MATTTHLAEFDNPIVTPQHFNCPKWLAFLNTIFAENAEMIRFVQLSLVRSLIEIEMSTQVSTQYICAGLRLQGRVCLFL